MRPFLRIRSAGSGAIISCAFVITGRGKQDIINAVAIRMRFIGFVAHRTDRTYETHMSYSLSAVATQREPAVYSDHLSGDVVVGFQQQSNHPSDVLWSSEPRNDLLLDVKVILPCFY